MARKRIRVSETIARRIRKQILDGKLPRGARLPAERELALKHHVSRVSVREAYRTLEIDGLVEVRRGAEGGAFVAGPDHGPVSRTLEVMLRLGNVSLEELTEARLLIEPTVARLAARRAAAEDLEALGTLLAAQARAVRGDGDAAQYDLQFHRAIAEAAGNLPLRIVMHTIADLMIEAIAATAMAPDARHHVVDFHERIYEALCDRDEGRAHDLMEQHIVDIQTRMHG